VNYGRLQESAASFLAFEAFEKFRAVARKGDVFSFRGHPHRTYRGQLSVLCNAVPTLLAPSLHQIPDSLDPETRARKRHVDMLVNPSAAQVLKIRNMVEKSLTSFLDSEGFTSVHTPILTSGAGGAIARPFETEATEFAGDALTLRIAPELWLKRLIVGGMEKVYELGPAFRNEGVDATHNPEFYTCEFYEAYATLEDLMTKTEKMLVKISEELGARRGAEKDVSAAFAPPEIKPPFKRIDFLPSLEREMGQPLPDLSTDSAADEIKGLFTTQNIDIPSNPTLPRLLDALATHYLEPLSHSEPTFITHHPACLSPLAKHFTCPLTQQTISARAELFIRGWEVANMYEEENSPFEQRRKFLEQAKAKQEDMEAMEVDESYLAALEWGLPPTGGWGCGVDRLVMLFAGRERIGDVLAFGGLRNVVGLGRKRTRS
jgi:lysyl-tRNA synthetase class 2